MTESRATAAGDSWAYGKHFLITGASSGIGLHLSKHFTGVCERLTLVSRGNNGSLVEAVRELEKTRRNRLKAPGCLETVFVPRALDVRDKFSAGSLVREIYEEEGDQVDGFINCAGGSHRFALLESMSTDDIDEIMDVNGKAPMYWLRELLVRMKKNKMPDGNLKRGHIVMLSSRSGERPLPNLSVYAAAKASVEKLLEAARAEYASYRLAFTIVNPGSVNTPFTKFWPHDLQENHNAESMTVGQAIAPIVHALDSQFVYNRISYESVQQWTGEPGVIGAGND